jgi:hypothetical protein
MEKPIQRVQGIERVNFFGVRHLSPAGAYHLIGYLDKIKPKCVLIEGPSDANRLTEHMADSRVVLPIAVLAYTAEVPVATVLYPFADYSPEYQAILWAYKHKARVSFIDIPTEVSISLNGLEKDKDQEYYERTSNVYDGIAKLNEEHDYDSYWERNFEHNLNADVYNNAVSLQSAQTRELLETDPRDILREAFMARKISDEIASGYAPNEIVAVTGAYHAERLKNDAIPMSDKEMQKLPRRKSNFTLMPYSFYRLSSRSGYGAGNAAPEYFELMWKCMISGRMDEFPMEYATKLGRYIRENGGYCSTANVIEAARLSFALTYIKGGTLPTLADLHDACVACIGHGERDNIINAFAMLDIGTAFGSLPEGVSQTPIQDDMSRELIRLKLEKYKSTVSQALSLDLRENIKVKSKDAAFIDLNRSTFLHRLSFLGISFAKQARSNQEKATWREDWVLSWSPEAEIQLVESVLRGDTIQLAAAFLLKESLEACKDLVTASELVRTAYVCGLAGSVENAVRTLQFIAADFSDFTSLSAACLQLSDLILYGDIRQADTKALEPILRELFLRACLTLSDTASCDDKAAKEIADAMGRIHNVSQDNFEVVEDSAWVEALFELASRDDKNAKLSGLSFAILLERNLIDDEFCAKEINRRLSAGTPADIGAGWFEGMSMRNHYGLISRTELFRELDTYIKSLDDEEFSRSVVFMRRAFGSFEPREKESVAELLAELWGLDSGSVSVMLASSLDDTEIDALAEFDWE